MWAKLNYVVNIQVPLGALMISWIVMLIAIWAVGDISFRLGETSGLLKSVATR